MTRPKTKRTCIAVLAALLSCRAKEEERAPPLAVPPGVLVAHALGSINGLVYTNSLEAFACNYKRGFRWFEVDLTLTADGELVCFHIGEEPRAGMKRSIDRLELREVESKRYAGRYPIRSLQSLLEETDRLGDVVLVSDTKGWSPRMVEAFRRTVRPAPGKRRSTHFALQSYGEQDIHEVKGLSQEIGADVILTLYMSSADDARVEALAKEFGVLAVVADARRFTPWLSQRLHAAHIPIWVHTINDHREILELTRAGADGFYTDDYRPYEAAAADVAQGADCLAGSEPVADYPHWLERDILRPGDYWLTACATRRPNDVVLSGCGPDAGILGPSLSVPSGRTVRVELDVEAGATETTFWIEIKQKNRAELARPREVISLSANERRVFALEVPLPEGSPGIETPLGLARGSDRLIVHRLHIAHASSERSSAVGSNTAYSSTVGSLRAAP